MAKNKNKKKDKNKKEPKMLLKNIYEISDLQIKDKNFMLDAVREDLDPD